MRFLGAGVLTLAAIAIIVVVVAVPLVFVFRSSCPDQGGVRTEYTFVPPWDDPPSDCRQHERGYEILLDEIGL